MSSFARARARRALVLHAALLPLALGRAASAAAPTPAPPAPPASPGPTATPPPPAMPAPPAPPDVPGPSVTLDALLAHAETHAPALALEVADAARKRAARALGGAALPDNPELAIGAGPRFADDAIGVDLEVGLSQRFELGGERAARRRLGAALVREVEAEAADRRWDLHTTVHALFYQALVAHERVVLAQRVVAFQDDIARTVGKQRGAGQSSLLDERLALAESATARQALTRVVQAELALRQELALVSGWSAETPPRPKGTLAPITPLPPLEDLVALAVARRPDLAVLEARIAAARAKVRAADRDKSPEPTLALTYAREAAPGGGDAAHVVIATVALPLPLATANEPERAEARAELALAEAERARAEGEIDAEVMRAHRAARYATQRLEAYGNEVLPRFEENLEALRRAYALGELGLLDLASGRERFLTAQRDALDAQEDYFTALARLEHAVGVDVIDASREVTP